jgi:hypothetical protein
MPKSDTLPMSAVPKFGENCPKSSDLHTGDLLFPRRLDQSSTQVIGAQLQNNLGGASSETGGPTLRVLFDLDKEQGRLHRDGSKANIGWVPDITRLSFPKNVPSSVTMSHPTLDAPATDEAPPDFTSLLVNPYDPLHPALLAQTASAIPDMSDSEMDQWMRRILEIALPEIPRHWLNMSVPQFRASAIWRLLQSGLLSADVRLSFFIGHVGIVLKEGGNTWVIEANITDFSHNRVAIHPYHVPSDEKGITDQAIEKNRDSENAARDRAEVMRGWVNRRTALGELVWCASPNEITENDQQTLPNAARKYLGRPYGFFDHPEFGHGNRFYCAEFVHRVFKDVSPALAASIDDQRTWRGMRTYLNAIGDTQQADWISEILEEADFEEEHKFFVLPPALLWRSQSLEKKFFPTKAGKEGYDGTS